MDQTNPNDPIKVDLDKGSSKDFEIRTMADDLAQGKSMPRPEAPKAPDIFTQPEEVSSPIPPPPPAPKPLTIDTSIPLNEEISSPAPPPSPAASSSIPPELLLNDDQPRGGWLKSFLVGFVLVLLLGAIGIGTWWWYVSRNTQSVTPTTPTTTPTVVPTTPVTNPGYDAFLQADKTINLAIDDQENQDTFFKKLSQLVDSSKEGLPHDSLVRINLTKGDKPLPISEFGKLAGVDFSLYTKNQAFNLFFSVPTTDPVFGIAVSLDNPDTAKSAMLVKEGEFPAIANQIYGAYTKTALPQPASKTFLDNVYQSVGIRYLNFDSPSRSLSYAFFDNLLLIAGSRESIFMLIDRAKLAPILGTTKNNTEATTSPTPTTTPLP